MEVIGVSSISFPCSARQAKLFSAYGESGWEEQKKRRNGRMGYASRSPRRGRWGWQDEDGRVSDDSLSNHPFRVLDRASPRGFASEPSRAPPSPSLPGTDDPRVGVMRGRLSLPVTRSLFSLLDNKDLGTFDISETKHHKHKRESNSIVPLALSLDPPARMNTLSSCIAIWSRLPRLVPMTRSNHPRPEGDSPRFKSTCPGG